jgi:sterol 14-demethylase
MREADLIPATWLFTYLGCHPKWRNEARAEISKLVTSHSFLEAISERNSPHSLTTTTTALSSVPLSAWENETPVLDKLIHETLRIAQPHIAMRRNVGPDIYIDGKVIPTGTLVVYPLADVHLNPTIYPDPWKFDPERPQPKGNLAYLGWGGGACFFASSSSLKMRLELNLTMFLFFFFYTYSFSFWHRHMGQGE